MAEKSYHARAGATTGGCGAISALAAAGAEW